MTYGILKKIIKHFEERHAEFQPLFSRSDDTLTAPFVDFFCPQKIHRGEEIVLAKKRSRQSDHEKENFEHLHLFEMCLIFADLSAFAEIR